MELGSAAEHRARALPADAALDFAETPVVDAYHDLTPRMAATYDLFGNGRTALKATLGKYLDAATTASNYGLPNPTVAHPAERGTHVDRRRRRLHSGLRSAQPPRRTCVRAAATPAARIRTAISARRSSATRSIPHILSGWGVRPSDWQIGVSVQHEVLPRVSVEVGYFIRWFQGFTVTDNLAVTAGDFDQFSVTAPADPAAARRRQLHVVRALRRQAGVVRRDRQLHHLLGQLRRAVSALPTAWTSPPARGRATA